MIKDIANFYVLFLWIFIVIEKFMNMPYTTESHTFFLLQNIVSCCIQYEPVKI